jgi:hypothetical protein
MLQLLVLYFALVADVVFPLGPGFTSVERFRCISSNCCTFFISYRCCTYCLSCRRRAICALHGFKCYNRKDFPLPVMVGGGGAEGFPVPRGVSDG